MSFQYDKELIFKEFKIAKDKDQLLKNGKNRKKESYINRIQFFEDHIKTKELQPKAYANVKINFDKLLEAYKSPNPRDHFYMAVFGKTYAEKMREQEDDGEEAYGR